MIFVHYLVLLSLITLSLYFLVLSVRVFTCPRSQWEKFRKEKRRINPCFGKHWRV